MSNSPWGNVPEFPPEEPKDDKNFQIYVKDMQNKALFLFACIEQGLKHDNVTKILGIRSMSVLLHVSFNVQLDTLELDSEVPEGYFRVKAPETPLGFQEYIIERDDAKNIPISTN